MERLLQLVILVLYRQYGEGKTFEEFFWEAAAKVEHLEEYKQQQDVMTLLRQAFDTHSTAPGSTPEE